MVKIELDWQSSAARSELINSFYEQHSNALFRQAYSILRDTEAAEDVVHDVFVCLAKNYINDESIRNLKSYLVTSVINKSRDQLRKNKRKSVSLDHAQDISASTELPDVSINYAEDVSTLNHAMDRLPAEQRDVIILRYKAQMKFSDIADLHKTPISSVRSRYYHGLSKLRSILCCSIY